MLYVTSVIMNYWKDSDVNMMKIGILSGRPANGTILTKEEKRVWGEMLRVLKEDMQMNPAFKVCEIVVPVYSKFDIQVLRYAEELHYSTNLYLPSKEWGTTRLPPHQTALIKRHNDSATIIPSPNNRLIKMIEDCQIIYMLANSQGIEQFYPYLKDKPVIYFPQAKMRFTTEAEAEALDNKVDTLSAQEVNDLLATYYS